jgi:hypothetical protein
MVRVLLILRGPNSFRTVSPLIGAEYSLESVEFAMTIRVIVFPISGHCGGQANS